MRWICFSVTSVNGKFKSCFSIIFACGNGVRVPNMGAITGYQSLTGTFFLSNFAVRSGLRASSINILYRQGTAPVWNVYLFMDAFQFRCRSYCRAFFRRWRIIFSSPPRLADSRVTCSGETWNRKHCCSLCRTHSYTASVRIPVTLLRITRYICDNNCSSSSMHGVCRGSWAFSVAKSSRLRWLTISPP